MPIRVVVAEDSYLIRESLERLLRGRVDLELVAVCEDLDSLRAAIEAHSPDVVLTDIRMPPGGSDEGLRVAEELRERRPETGVLVLSQYAEPRYALRLLGEGSEGRGYLLKERVSDAEQIASAIREVARRGSVVDPKLVDGLLAARSAERRSPLNELTSRERETLAEMAQGKSNAAIATGFSRQSPFSSPRPTSVTDGCSSGTSCLSSPTARCPSCRPKRWTRTGVRRCSSAKRSIGLERPAPH